MWWANYLCNLANEDLGTLAEYDPLTDPEGVSQQGPEHVLERERERERLHTSIHSADSAPQQQTQGKAKTDPHLVVASSSRKTVPHNSKAWEWPPACMTERHKSHQHT